MQRAWLVALSTILTSAAVHAAPATAPDDDEPAVSLKLGKGLSVRSPDKKNSINLRPRIQLRGTVSRPATAAPLDEPELEFVARRIRLLINGEVLGEFSYYVQLAFSNQDTESDLRLPLRDAYVTWTRFRDVNVRFGQMKVPFGRQRVVSSSALQFVDRSLVTGELNLDRDVGITLRSDDVLGLGGRLGYAVGLFGGDGRNRLATAPGAMLVGRLELRPLGGFKDDREGDLDRSRTPGVALGLSGAWNRGSNRARSTHGSVLRGRADYAHLGADVHAKWFGFSLLGEVLWRRANADVLTTVDDGETITERTRSALGAYVQGGVLVVPHLELVARYGELWPLVGGLRDLPPTRELGTGLNIYVHDHDLKLQGDYFYVVEDNRFTAGDHGVRVQFQLYF